MIVREINERRALRALSDKRIDPEVVDRIFSAASLAPSCMNKQPWRFLVLDSRENLEIVSNHLAGGNYWAKKSPAVVAVLTRQDLDARLPGERNYAYFDTGMACMNLQIQAWKEGVIAHPIAGFEAVELREALGIDKDWILLTLIIMGYPGLDKDLSEKHRIAEKSARQRKAMGEVVFYNTFEGE
jgi:nitroreductase